MANLIIGYRDFCTTATSITASSALSTLPATNLALPQLERGWQTATGVTSANITVDMGGTVTIGDCCLINTNLTAAATCRVRVSTADATGAAGDALDTGTVSAGVDPDYGKMVRVFSSNVSGRYFRIDLTDTSLTGGIYVGRLAILRAIRFTRNYAFGWKLLGRDFTNVSLTESGSEYALRGNYQRGISFTLPAITITERDGEAEKLRRTVGTFDDILVVRDPDSTNLGRDSFWGRLQQLPEYTVSSYPTTEGAFVVWDRI